MIRCSMCMRRRAHMYYRLVHSGVVVPLCEICAEDPWLDKPSPVSAIGE